MMADEETPETPVPDSEGHAVPSEQAAEIAASLADLPRRAAPSTILPFSRRSQPHRCRHPCGSR